MTAISIFLTLLLLFVILAAGAWCGFLVRGRLASLETECRRMRLAAVQEAQQFESQKNELVARIEAIERRATETQQRPLQGINYTQRSQMLRMVRRGDPAEQIANTLGVPVSQVRLLMKLPGAGPARGKEKVQVASQ